MVIQILLHAAPIYTCSKLILANFKGERLVIVPRDWSLLLHTPSHKIRVLAVAVSMMLPSSQARVNLINRAFRGECAPCCAEIGDTGRRLYRCEKIGACLSK